MIDIYWSQNWHFTAYIYKHGSINRSEIYFNNHNGFFQGCGDINSDFINYFVVNTNGSLSDRIDDKKNRRKNNKSNKFR